MASAAHKTPSCSASSTYLLAILTGLLSSSCCLLQLFLNALSISCAGFSVLNPYRGTFLFLTLTLIVTTIRRYGLLTRPSLTTILICVLLSASSEIVGLHNEGKLELDRGDKIGAGDHMEVFELQISGLSCQACANKLKLWIEKHGDVMGCEVYLNDMKAVVRSRPGKFPDEASLESLVADAGTKYHGKVVKRYTVSSDGDIHAGT